MDDDQNNVHSNSKHPICNGSTKFSVIVEFENTYPENNQNIIWFAPSNPCINPYTPIHFNIDEFPIIYSRVDYEKATENHFQKDENDIKNNPEHSSAIFLKRSRFIDTNYQKLSISGKNFKTHFEDYATRRFEEKPTGSTSFELLMKLYAAEKNFRR